MKVVDRAGEVVQLVEHLPSMQKAWVPSHPFISQMWQGSSVVSGLGEYKLVDQKFKDILET